MEKELEEDELVLELKSELEELIAQKVGEIQSFESIKSWVLPVEAASPRYVLRARVVRAMRQAMAQIP